MQSRSANWTALHPSGWAKEPEAAFQFVQQCIDILRPGGALLLGDLPNRNSRKRFADAHEGAKFDLQWSKSVAESRAEHEEFYDIFARYGGVPKPYFNDAFVRTNVRSRLTASERRLHRRLLNVMHDHTTNFQRADKRLCMTKAVGNDNATLRYRRRRLWQNRRD